MTIDEVKNLVHRKLLGAETVMSYSVFLVAAYVVGHIVAYLSSITVERFLIWWYGYPSEFLLREQRMDFYFFKEAQKMYKEKDKCWKWTLFRTYFLRLIVLMFLFPITLSSLLVRIFGGDSFFVKKLDDFLMNDMKNTEKETKGKKFTEEYEEMNYVEYVINKEEWERKQDEERRSKIVEGKLTKSEKLMMLNTYQNNCDYYCIS